MTEKIKPGYGRFAALKREADRGPGVCRLKNSLDQLIGQSFRHHAHAMMRAILGFVFVKAILASKVA